MVAHASNPSYVESKEEGQVPSQPWQKCKTLSQKQPKHKGLEVWFKQQNTCIVMKP
jgi:hypothetical protein